MANCTKCGAPMPELSAGLKAWYAKPENAHLKPKTWCEDCCKASKAPKAQVKTSNQTTRTIDEPDNKQVNCSGEMTEAKLLLEIHNELVEVFGIDKLKECQEIYGSLGWVTTIYLDRKKANAPKAPAKRWQR